MTALRSPGHALQTSYNRMPTLTIRITDEMMSWVESRVQPFHQKSDVVRGLIASAMNSLDTPVMLAERAEASEASTSTSKCIHIDLEEEFKNKTINQLAVKSPKKASKSRVRPDYTSEFVAFWNEYQRAPIKANAQSKNKAFDAWREAVKLEAPERLLEAARRAVEQVKQAKIQDEWCAPLPDAFRWLRDERYAVHLEDHRPAGPQVINGITVYD